MSDVDLDRLRRAQEEGARLHAELITRKVRIELARSKRIDTLRREADERYRQERAQINAAAGYANPALARQVREAKSQGSALEQRRRQRLQDLADTLAAHHGDTPTLQAERRDAMQTSDTYYRPARRTA